VIGIQFDHDFVRVAIADLSLTVLAEGVRASDVDHDAEAGLDAAAALVDSLLAEAGAGRGAMEMAYVMMSSGIGGGLILGGRLYRGARGTAGEIGHVSVDEAGHMCRCGSRGCLETLVGARALIESLRRSHGGEITIEGMISLARDGDPGCQRVIADAGRIVGRVVAALCNEFNPERIVVGGELALAGDLLLEPLREAVGRYAIPAAAEELTVVPGELGDQAELMGALALVIDQSEQVLTGRVQVATSR
jgi:predicted NBD/HSP70 family sugar kinase